MYRCGCAGLSQELAGVQRPFGFLGEGGGCMDVLVTCCCAWRGVALRVAPRGGLLAPAVPWLL